MIVAVALSHVVARHCINPTHAGAHKYVRGNANSCDYVRHVPPTCPPVRIRRLTVSVVSDGLECPQSRNKPFPSTFSRGPAQPIPRSQAGVARFPLCGRPGHLCGRGNSSGAPRVWRYHHARRERTFFLMAGNDAENRL